MTSNQDILAFLKSNQEKLAREKEDDRRIRASERQEDREKILELIKTGVKNEVKSAIKELELKLEQQEKVNKDLAMELESMAREMEVLRNTVKSQSTPVTVTPNIRDRGEEQVKAQSEVEEYTPLNQVISDKVQGPEQSLSSAKKTLGFQCIYPEDIERQFRQGARSEREARLMAFKE